SLQRSFVFQNYSLFPWFSLRENIALAIKKAHPELSGAERRSLAETYLEQVGLADAAKKYPFELSGGMQQRGAIARALAIGAPVLLMDEPFGALDPVNRSRLQDLLLSVWRNASADAKTVIFVTHDVDEAILLSVRIVMLGSSPAGIIDEICVDIPRPRSRLSVENTEVFSRLRERIQKRFRDEINRALGGIVSGGGDGI
ncbi:MAG: ABC transporter ATP-binding protein, partial [Opitutales bacterium]|nr:ABC transporter ATP-binding protein [Opitutales bacterium]